MQNIWPIREQSHQFNLQLIREKAEQREFLISRERVERLSEEWTERDAEQQLLSSQSHCHELYSLSLNYNESVNSFHNIGKRILAHSRAGSNSSSRDLRMQFLVLGLWYGFCCAHYFHVVLICSSFLSLIINDIIIIARIKAICAYLYTLGVRRQWRKVESRTHPISCNQKLSQNYKWNRVKISNELCNRSINKTIHSTNVITQPIQ